MTNYQFILIDDEDIILTTLSKIVEKSYPGVFIHTFKDGESAIEYLEKQTGLGIIISDYNINIKTGLEILINVRKNDKLKNFYFMMITANSDKELKSKVIQSGADGFLNKPFTSDEIISKLGTAVKIIKLYDETISKTQKIDILTEESHKNSATMIKIINTVLTKKIPKWDTFLARFVPTALWIAGEYGIDEANDLDDIEKVAKIALVGKLSLPDKYVADNITLNGFIKNEDYKNIPVFARNLITDIPHYQKVANILYHVYENFDGTGYPEGLAGTKIPIGSRILRILLDYEELLLVKGSNFGAILEILELEVKRIYDFKVLTLFDQYQAYLSYANKYNREVAVNRKELDTGMVLSRHIYTESGYKIMAAGTVLKEEQVSKIKEMTKNDPVIGRIYIQYVAPKND